MAAPEKAVILFEAQGADRVATEAKKVRHDLEKISKTGGRLNNAFRGMRGGAAQLGYQIQDVAVQLQSGTNAMMVFGQQGSQIASIMGPGGALIGAVIAVGAAIGSAMLPNLFEGERSFEDLEEQILSTAKSFGTMTQAQADALVALNELKQLNLQEEQLQLEKEIRNTVRTLEEQQASLDRNIERGEGYGRMAKAARMSNERFAKDVEETSRKLKFLQASLDVNTQQYRLLGETIDQIESGDVFGEQAEALKEAKTEAQQFLENLQLQAATMGNNTEETLRYRMGLMQLTAAQREEADVYLQIMEEKRAAEEKLKEEQKARQAVEREAQQVISGLNGAGIDPVQAIREQEEQKLAALAEAQAMGIEMEMSYAEARKRIQEQANRDVVAVQQASMTQAAQMMSQQLGILQQAFGEGTALGKAAFAAQKGLAVAQAIVSAEAGAARALAEMPYPLNIGVSNMIRALGYASAGAIAGQAVASFEGGGITFNGVRSGGMDGKGGRMAMVHPNEKITDLEQGGGGAAPPVNVSFNITANDSKGFDRLLMERRSMITNLVNQAINNRGRSSLA